MKSKNGTFVFIKPHILITGNSRRIIVGWKDSVTGHFEFKDAEVWARFNQHIARIKGYPLFEETKAKGRAKAAA